jgi:hypothetical protein
MKKCPLMHLVHLDRKAGDAGNVEIPLIHGEALLDDLHVLAWAFFKKSNGQPVSKPVMDSTGTDIYLEKGIFLKDLKDRFLLYNPRAKDPEEVGLHHIVVVSARPDQVDSEGQTWSTFVVRVSSRP